MMSKQTDSFSKHLKKLGISEEESSIYLYLAENPQSTALRISKELRIGRTKVYRILDTLYKKGLTDQQVGYRGFVFATQPFENLDKLVLEKEMELNELKSSIPTLKKELDLLNNRYSRSKDHKVIYYEGAEGIKQVTWNSTKTKELVLYGIGSMNSLPGVGRAFAEKVRQEMLNKKAHTRELTNQKTNKGFSKLSEYVKDYFEQRCIDPKILKIEVETLIYNDVVALYHVDEKDPFCVEIHNPKLAQQQKQLFNYVWETVRKMKKVSSGSKRRVV